MTKPHKEELRARIAEIRAKRGKQTRFENWVAMHIDDIAELIEQERAEAAVIENESFKEIFEDTQTWVQHCYYHEAYNAHCHACRQRKWFKELSAKVIPIIDERLTALQTNKEKIDG